MASTTFSGPVTSLNGFIGGTSAAPISVTTAGNINSSYGDHFGRHRRHPSELSTG
jgi:hypothetical protein